MKQHPVSPSLPARYTRIGAIVISIVCATLLSACASRPVAAPIGPGPARESNLVVLVSIDGLPASMLGQGVMPTLDRIASEGVHAAWMNPSFPTATFPNHHTIATGLRPDHHGIVHNNMIDPALGIFVSKESSADDGRWWGGEPIWATLQKQGGIAATMFWPGSRAEIAGQRPRYSRAFDKTLTPAARVDQVLTWLDLPQRHRPQLATLYFDQYDVASHAAGSHSVPALAALRDIDSALARLEAGLSTRRLGRNVALIVVSDHGMADVPKANSLLLDDVLDTARYNVEWWGTFIGLRPHADSVDVVTSTFVGKHDHFECWRKGELPAVWHYGTHPRIPPIVCQVEANWRLQARDNPPQRQPIKGEHGFAPEDPTMRAVFVAKGPAFRSGVVLPPFDNVDVYSLLAYLLKVTPAANDGSLSSTEAALR